MFLEIISQSLVNGSIYALLALGFALIFGAARIVNLYHGTFYMLGAYFTYSFYNLGLPIVLASVLSLIVVAGVGYGVFKIIEPIRKKGVAVLIVTIGLAFLTQELVRIFYGTSNKNLPGFLKLTNASGEGITRFEFLGLGMEVDRFFALVVSVVMMAVLWFFIDRTKTGKAVMATAQDEEAAMSVGIRPKLVNFVAISFSAVLAGMAGIVTAPFYPIHFHMWLPPLIKAFSIVILGGLGSVWGSVLAAFILAITEALARNLINPGLGEVMFLVVVLVILVVRPQGLLGKPLRF